MIPKMRKRPRMGVRQPSQIRCAGHLQWVRRHACCIDGKAGHQCVGKIVAHHAREGADGGMGLKPSDSTTVPLCDMAHGIVHQIGWQSFEARYGVDLSKIAAELWRVSPHRIKWESRNDHD